MSNDITKFSKIEKTLHYVKEISLNSKMPSRSLNILYQNFCQCCFKNILDQGSTLTFQLTSLVGTGNLDITSKRKFLLAKRCNSEMSSLRKTETSSVNLFYSLAKVASGNRKSTSQN